MQTASLTEWLSSPETRALVVYLKFRQMGAVADFLRPAEVNPLIQGKAAGCNEIERLLKKTPEEIIEVFDNAARELNEQHRRT